MVRALLATTALAALLTTASIAQDTMSSSQPPMSEAPMSSEMSMSSEMPISSEMSAPAAAPMSTVTPTAAFDITTGYTRIDTDRLSSRMVGQPVYDGTAADANNLGNINDLVLNEAGMVQAVVIGVGGFLGIGEKQVAVAYSALQWVIAADNTERFVLNTTVEQLTNAPDFVTVDDAPSAM